MTGHYHKFVRNYEKIAAPLTTLLKKDAFFWTPEATKAFEHPKEIMCQATVLATPDFTKTFIVECDASENGIGAFLMQEGRPISFEKHLIKGKYLQKTYLREGNVGNTTCPKGMALLPNGKTLQGKNKS